MATGHGSCTVCGMTNGKPDTAAGYYLSLPEDICVLKCRKCGLRWLNPMKTPDEYGALYQSSYFEALPENYDEVVKGRVSVYRDRLKQIQKVIGKTPSAITLLDIGAATGDFVNEALKLGFQAYGIEPSQAACDKARKMYGIELIQGDFLHADLHNRLFDVIHLNHVLEHIASPHQFMHKIYSSLSSRGLVVIEVPYQFGNLMQNVGRALRVIKPSEFSIYSIHHPYFYTPKSLGLFLVSHGFTVIMMNSWIPYLKEKLKEARSYCTARIFFFIEQYIRLGHIVWKDKGKSNFMIAFAKKKQIK